jgi:UDP-4-amino-4,6-dideoxy-N-acetyl-beta-L-altrosamine transaminase
MTAPFLPYGRQCIDETDVAAVAAALRSDWLTTGPAVAAFEDAFAAAVGAPWALACANGTAALHLAMMALDVGPGDAAIVPSITFVATANAAHYVGATPVFADVDPDTGLMTAASLEDAIARAKAAGLTPKVALPVHYAGQTAPMSALAQAACANGLHLVEDACHALGTVSDAGAVGACEMSVLSTFSFHPVKTIACGEGGMVTGRDPALAARIRRDRSHGLVREAGQFIDPALSRGPDGQANPWAYEMPAPGFNYRLSDINAALGSSQLARLSSFAERRRRLAGLYAEALPALGPHVRPLATVPGSHAVLHLQVALIDFAGLGLSRGAVMRALAARGIGSQVHYIPVHRQPFYATMHPGLTLPGAEAFYARCLSLPLFPDMADADVGRVVAALGDVLGGGG